MPLPATATARAHVVLRLFVAPFGAALLAAWWLIGDLSHEDGWLTFWQIVLPHRYATAVGVTGLLIVVVAVTDWVRSWRHCYHGNPTILFVLACAAVLCRHRTLRRCRHRCGVGGARRPICGGAVAGAPRVAGRSDHAGPARHEADSYHHRPADDEPWRSTTSCAGTPTAEDPRLRPGDLVDG